MNPLPAGAPADKIATLLGEPLPPAIGQWNGPTTTSPVLNIATTFTGMSAAEITAMKAVLREFEEVANIRFVDGSGTDFDFVLQKTNLGRNGGDGGSFFSFNVDGNGTVTRNWDANIRIDDDHNLTNPSLKNLLLHEIGHALGLKHPGPYDVSGNIPPGPYLPEAEDNNSYSVMSYHEHLTTGGFPGELQLYDITALQALWGANYNTRSGNTTYFGTGSDPAFALANGGTTALSIWDGGGIDTISANNQTSRVEINLNEGAFSSIGPVARTISIAYGAVIENATGGSGNDLLIGNAANNVLRGGAGDDRLEGGAGNDTLLGEAGADTMLGGAGNDRYYVSNMKDIVIEAVGGGTDTVYSTYSYTLRESTSAAPVEIENLRANYDGTTGITLVGNSLANHIYGGVGNDRLEGGGGNDRLEGGAGNDTLLGGPGTDTMLGGTGNDRYYVSSASDIVIEAAGGGSDTVFTSVSYALRNSTSAKPVEVEFLRANYDGTTGITLTGNSLANKIYGGDGADKIVGGGGRDMLTGGLGADSFVFKTAADSPNGAPDRVLDFSHAQHDRIDLSGLFGDTLDFIGSANFTGDVGEVRTFTSGSLKMVAVNLDADLTPEFTLQVASSTTLVAGDFIL